MTHFLVQEAFPFQCQQTNSLSPSGGVLHIILRLADDLADFLFEGRHVLPELDPGIDVRRGVRVWFRQHRHHRHDDLLHPEDGSPALLGRLLLIERVLARRVENRNAHLSVFVHVRVPHLALERHFRRLVRKIRRERELSFEEPTFVKRVRGPDYHELPEEHVRVIY
eukprot:CAMPEP_0181263286 /NCGR_PEP_ID=MMETSP1097-20121128/2504_1 /TAXON_ID=35684 /ORGANISM="Pseudopedinella elastica, Strain CCMP716" /LENGTH=166 /DNA_ID=CAMNT_0023362073 /DNA_START=75 /DNA_END=575 /DNA_ORIENTATION=-